MSAEKYLIQNKCNNPVLNLDGKNSFNLKENAENWVYASDAMEQFANQQTAAKDAQIKELREALDSLVQYQNGAPLARYEKEYNEAYENAVKTLEKTKPHEP